MHALVVRESHGHSMGCTGVVECSTFERVDLLEFSPLCAHFFLERVDLSEFHLYVHMRTLVAGFPRAA
ncbi:hypothetical protein DUNSADRAFT_17052 [Dunaliella salina]|uniref:Encoded protein n=1 Tax=Dunaliella salina TaxID=3046 RepID=A0ABQ7H0G8_DUNSA|nr:hypothetical protein DUNSADRAFT_17052 [Dunaliella salina]|eukprot:KAF5840355.1 hypothetical protein DUNSADRAFT_17052 [Dunaliella salina]